MAKVEQLYELLVAGPTPACDEILSAGLALAEPDYFDRLVDLLLRRKNEAAWGGLIEHWPRLTFDVQAILQSDAAAMLGGISRAMRGAPDARYHALLALAQSPRVGAAYLLPAALRDPQGRTRDAAARCFYHVAEAHYDRMTAVQSGMSPATVAFTEEHAQMISAVSEVLATFDVHLRVELVEACLWFAAELGGSIWDRLGKSRTRLARVVTIHLEEWNSPRMAAFLLLALRESEWRTPAQKILRDWTTAKYAAPLLRHTQLLADPETASGVAVLRTPQWISGADAGLANLPAPLRPCLPTWIARVGVADTERVQLLGACAQRGDTDTRAAALDALAMLERGGAAALLREFAERPDGLGLMARKSLEQKRQRSAAAMPQGPMVQGPLPAEAASGAAAASQTQARGGQPGLDATGVDGEVAKDPSAAAVDEFLQLWTACRRAQGDEHTALISQIRAGVRRWQAVLLGNINSADARDRMQLLRVMDTPNLRKQFGQQLASLANDPMPAVRGLAQRVLELHTPESEATAATGPSDEEAEA